MKNISKTFRLPHRRINTIREKIFSFWTPNSFEEFHALKDISFEVKKGEFFGIIGRNGSGKSTLLKILAGIYPPDNGKIHIEGAVSPFLELGIGFNGELSGRENIYLNGAVLGLSHKQIYQKFDQIVAFSELERFIDQKLKNYSSGMQVRLAFSVAIHANREILLMDEVLAVGDINFQAKCMEEFQTLRMRGKTIVFVTHNISAVQQYCDKALLLREGKIEAIGKPEEVVSHYIHQNISDEETRMQGEIIFPKEEEGKKEKLVEKEENLKQNSKITQKCDNLEKIAEIISVEFLDEKGQKKNVFRTGENMSVRVYFQRNNLEKELHFGIALCSLEGHYIFGVNTIFDKIDTTKYLSQGYYELSYKNIPIRTNSYFVKSAIFGSENTIIYDWLEKSSFFKVVSENHNEGMTDILYSWQ